MRPGGNPKEIPIPKIPKPRKRKGLSHRIGAREDRSQSLTKADLVFFRSPVHGTGWGSS
jgi:hypothetical protein